MFYIHGKHQKPLRSFKVGDIVFFLCRPWNILSKTFTVAGIPIYYLGSVSGDDRIYLADSILVFDSEACYADEPDLPF